MVKNANPMIVAVGELLRRVGAQRDLSIHADVDGLATTDAAVHGPVDLQLHLESVAGGVQVTGTVSAAWRGSCRRCLAPIEQSVQQAVREMFSPSPADDEIYPIRHSEADLTPMVHDCLILALPIAPLCAPDCAGPAPDSYPVHQPGTAEEEQPRDPRWAPLDALRTGQ